MCLISPKSHLKVCLDCQVCNDDLKLQKNVFQKIFSKKKKLQIRSPYLMLASRLLYQLGHICYVVLSGMLLNFFVFNPLQSTNWMPCELVVLNLKYTYNGFMVFGSWSVDAGSSRWVIGMTDKEKDKHKNFLLVHKWI